MFDSLVGEGSGMLMSERKKEIKEKRRGCRISEVFKIWMGGDHVQSRLSGAAASGAIPNFDTRGIAFCLQAANSISNC